jgi:hypothetical protein
MIILFSSVGIRIEFDDELAVNPKHLSKDEKYKAAAELGSE